jgi:hypothetical protein
MNRSFREYKGMGHFDCFPDRELMSRSDARIRFKPIHWIALAMLLVGMSQTLHAQYPGRIKKDADTTPPLRATGVFEWTGDIAKPKAGRLIPVAVWDGAQYQPGGLYLAQPAPLTVYTGTVYELQQAGSPKGLFQVNGAENLQGSWIAIGAVKPEFPVAKPKRTTAKLTPQVVKDADSDRPTLHRKAGSEGDSGSSSDTTTSAPSDSNKPTLHRKDSGDSNSGNSGSQTSSSGSTQTTSSSDPDRPTLHRRDSSDSSSGSGSGNSSGSGSSSDSGSSTASSVDPDRPTLHRPASKASNDSGAPVTATADLDPDRPKLRYGKPEKPEGMVEPSKLEGLPADMNQMTAISDAKPSEPHSYAYSWADPGDAAKMQAVMEDLAKKALLGKQAPAKPAATSTVPRTGAKSTVRRKAAPPPQPALPALEDEKFRAFELAYNAGATLVLTAKSTGDDKVAKYVTLIAQPDFYGVPQVIFQQVTSDDRLEITPRMRLVDAVDTDADRRAELVFELRGKTGRAFAIYRVVNRKVDEAFNTGPLP